jgi:PAS domain-containing protein
LLHAGARVETTRRLKQSEARAATLLENGTDRFFAVDETLRLTAANRRFRNLAGRMLERDVEDGLRAGVMALPDCAAWADACKKALAGDTVTVEREHDIDGPAATSCLRLVS